MRQLRAVMFACLLLGASSPAAAQYIGSASCGGSECHTKRELTWWSREPGGKEHKNSLATLDRAPDKSQRYAQAVKLQDYKDPKGMCLQCHGTPQLIGGLPEGVGCEGCHNPAAKWKQYHSNNYKPENYKQSVGLGMADLKGNTKQWVKVCTDCHKLDGKTQYDPLVEDGHPDGRRWNVSAKYALVAAHWKATTQALYTPDKVKSGVGVTPPATETKPDPAEKPDKPPEKPDESEKPTEKPLDKRNSGPPIVPRAGSGGGGRPPKLPPASPPAPADPVPASPAPRVEASPLTLPLPQPTTPGEMLAALQGRVAAFLTRLLKDDVTPSQPLQPLPAPAQVSGPDAELLQLQAEALALAVEALNLKAKAPPKPPDK